MSIDQLIEKYSFSTEELSHQHKISPKQIEKVTLVINKVSKLYNL